MKEQEMKQHRPITIQGTSRQRVTTRSGSVLERAYIVMPPASWVALQRLCVAQHRSGSQVIENLIASSSGTHTKDNNDNSSTRSI